MKLYPTNIKELDELLGGGLSPDRGYMICGEAHTGKRLLALTIQKASLERGEYCLYVTYGQSYNTIMTDYRGIDIDPERYMKDGLLKITDYYSLDFFELDELKERLSPVEKGNVIFLLPEDLENEEKRKKYTTLQEEAISKIGKAGLVIIDSLTERLQRSPTEIVLGQWKAFRERLTKGRGLLALHLYTPLVHKDLSEFLEMFNYFEDGTIELNITPDNKRKLRCLFRIPPSVDRSWHNFTIRNNTIEIQKIREEIETSYLKKAIELSKNCKNEDERIHPKVGVVVVKDKKIVCEAYRGEIRDGEHAEYTALERKCHDKNLRGVTFVTTLEPCTTRSHLKIPCVKHILKRGIGKVVIGMLDPNPKIRGKGALLLQREEVLVEYFPGELAKEVWNLNKDFIDEQWEHYEEKQPRDKDPYVTIQKIEKEEFLFKSMRELLISKLNMEEVKDICFELNLDYEDLGGEGKSGKIRELLLHLKRHESLDKLLFWIKKKRKDIWTGIKKIK